MNTGRRKTLATLFLLTMLFLPITALAQEERQLFIPCGFDNNPKDGVVSAEEQCGFYDLLRLVKNVLDWLVMISFSVAIITFAWAGIVLTTSGGNAGQKDKAKKMLLSVVIGFAIIVAAWLIVRTIVNVILEPGLGDQFIKLN
jgi:hypothetical protein